MKAFEYVYPNNLKAVPRLLAKAGDKALLYAGGTDALARMKEGIVEPEMLINLKKLPELAEIREDRKGLYIGAAARLVDIIDNKQAQAYAGLIEAVKSVGTIQLRNMGTLGGNLCQRPRCWYYRNVKFDCLRKGGDTCFAVDGDNKYHCIIGGDPCFIVHPSDIAPMLIALDATFEISGAKKRKVAAADFFILPEEDPYHENVLARDEFVTGVFIPKKAKSLASHYVKFRERDSFDFAMVSVAVAANVDGKTLSDVRIAYGGVAPKPWPAALAEKMLEGVQATEENILAAAAKEFANAEPLDQNEYKVLLARNLLKRAFRELQAI